MVELTVSLALLSVLVVAFVGVFGQVSRSWIGAQTDIERRRNERALTDFIASELRSAVVPVEHTATVGKKDLQFLINPDPALVPPEYANADTIFWQAPIATETTFGDLAEVGYFVSWKDRRASLRRLFINPSAPGPRGEPQPNALFMIYTNQRWLSSTVLDRAASAEPPLYQGLFAENVIGFWVRAYRPDGVELVVSGKKQFDSRVGYTFTNSANKVEERFLPSTVQISLAQLDSATAPHLDQTWQTVQAMTRSSQVHDASEFLSRMRVAAQTDRSLARLLPGLRIYTTEVRLENAR